MTQFTMREVEIIKQALFMAACEGYDDAAELLNRLGTGEDDEQHG